MPDVSEVIIVAHSRWWHIQTGQGNPSWHPTNAECNEDCNKHRYHLTINCTIPGSIGGSLIPWSYSSAHFHPNYDVQYCSRSNRYSSHENKVADQVSTEIFLSFQKISHNTVSTICLSIYFYQGCVMEYQSVATA